MQSSPRITHSILKRLVLVLMLTLSISSCQTGRQVEVVEHIQHDTCYVVKAQYDSVYVSENRERVHDTLYITQQEHRYRLLHDTVRVVKTDTIPVIREVEVPRKGSGWEWKVVGVVLVVLVLAWFKGLRAAAV